MVIPFGNLLIWSLIAGLVGFVGELLARRRTPFGIVGAMVVGFLAIVLVVGVLHWHIDGEPYLNSGSADHVYPRSGGARGSLERLCVSPCLWLLFALLLQAWRLCAQASPVLVGDRVPW